MLETSITTCAGLLGLCAGLPNKICADIWNAPRLVHDANGGTHEYLTGSSGDLYNFTLENVNRYLAGRGKPKLKKGEVAGNNSGSSCQGMSEMNPKRHPFDPRNFLMLEQVRIVREFLPQWVIWEQVPSLLENKITPFRQLLFQVIERDLAADYHVDVRVLNAKHYGAYQDRERLIFMLVRKDLGKLPSYPPPGEVQPSQFLSSLIPGVCAFKSGKSWKNADNVIGTMTRGGVKLLLEDGTVRYMSAEEKKLICGFSHLNLDIDGVSDHDKHVMLGNSVAYQFGLTLNRHCLKEYRGIDI